jgi:hypothetical protein
VRVRYYTKVLGYYLSSDKRVIKGPGAPKREVASEAKRMVVRAELGRYRDTDIDEKTVAPVRPGSDAASMSD